MTILDTFETLQHETPRGDLATLGRLVIALGEPRPWEDKKVIVEVGSWTGRTALALAQHRCVVHCIDHWQGNKSDRLGAIAKENDVYECFMRNTSHIRNSIIPHTGLSAVIAAEWDLPADLVFIDAEHTYESCKADTLAWLPHLKPGGFMAWHDYGVFDGVTDFLNEFGIDDFCGSVAWKQKQI